MKPPAANLHYENGDRRCSFNWASLPATRAALDYMISSSKFKYKGPRQIILTNGDNKGHTIKSPDMDIDDLLEVTPLAGFADIDIQACKGIDAIRRTSAMIERELPPGADVKAKARREPTIKVQPIPGPAAKADTSGRIQLADLATELGVPPQKIRKALRTAQFVKPEGGWHFSPEEVEAVKALVK